MLHAQVDRMQLDIKDSIQLIMDYKKAYEETYEKIPIEGLSQKEKPKKKVLRAKPLDNEIVSSNFNLNCWFRLKRLREV